MNSLGIDPGKDGALVLLDPDDKILIKEKTPLFESSETRDEYNIPRLIDLISIARAVGPCIAVVEKQQPLPAIRGGNPCPVCKQPFGGKMMGGTIANFNRGFASALYQTIFTMMGQSFHVIPPKTWQKVMFTGINAADTKQASILAASRIWPAEDFRATKRAIKANHGLTDAALLARFGHLKLMPIVAPTA